MLPQILECFWDVCVTKWDGTVVHRSFTCYLLYSRSWRTLLQKVVLSDLNVAVENTELLVPFLEGAVLSVPWLLGWWPLLFSSKGMLVASFSSETLICISPTCCQNVVKAKIPLTFLTAAGPINGNRKWLCCWSVFWAGIWRGHSKDDAEGKYRPPGRSNSETAGFSAAGRC